MLKVLMPLLLLISAGSIQAQPNGPWNSPLKIAWSTDGRQFASPTIFQDSSGVPSVVRWKGDTLVAAFQWFREPRTAPTWDRVAVKFSYDAGMTWTEPTPIVVDGIPSNYQRPFDPTLAVVDGRLRIDFSSNDVINYTFEPGARFDHAERAVIDLVNDTTVRFYGSGRISRSVWKGATHQPSRSMTSAGRSMTSDEGRFTTDVLGRRMEDPSGPGLFFEVTVDPDGSLTVRKFISDR